jgi:hypothetical protein
MVVYSSWHCTSFAASRSRLAWPSRHTCKPQQSIKETLCQNFVSSCDWVVQQAQLQTYAVSQSAGLTQQAHLTIAAGTYVNSLSAVVTGLSSQHTLRYSRGWPGPAGTPDHSSTHNVNSVLK